MTPPPELRHIIQRTRDRDRREGAREGRPPFPTRRRLQLRWRRSPPRLLSFLPSSLRIGWRYPHLTLFIRLSSILSLSLSPSPTSLPLLSRGKHIHHDPRT